MGENERKKALFEKALSTNAQKSMLTPFFLKQKNLQFIELSIINPKTSTRFHAVRNKQCLNYKCIYDLPDVLTRLKTSKYNTDYIFECKTCSNYIKLKDFCFDETLNKEIESYWNKFNHTQTEFIGIKFFRDGKTAPLFKSQPKKQQADDSSGSEEEEKQGIFHEKREKASKTLKFSKKRLEIDFLEEKTIIPSFEDFEADELEDLLEKTGQKGDFLTIFGNVISTKEIGRLHNDEILSEGLLAFFLKALERGERIRNVKKRGYFAAFLVESFERKKANFEMNAIDLPGLEFNLTEKDFLEEFRFVGLATKYQERWVGYLIHHEEGHTFATIVDFLDPDLNMESATEFIDILKEFLREKQANFIKIVNFEFFRRGKIGKYIDFGVYLLAFFWKMTEKFISVGSLKLRFPRDKDQIRDLLVWMALKTRSVNYEKRK